MRHASVRGEDYLDLQNYKFTYTKSIFPFEQSVIHFRIVPQIQKVRVASGFAEMLDKDAGP